jgi:hypothetical protein
MICTPALPIASIDLFVVPTIAFEQLFAFVVLGHGRRHLLWLAVTRNPTAEWLARQITEAFPWDRAPKYLIRDNDQAFGIALKARLRAMGSALYEMTSGKDKSALDALNAKVQAASTKLDSALASMTGADAKVAADFKEVWDQFKATRDQELIPAIYKGDIDAAKKIANGIQFERLSKMWNIMCRTR